MIAPRSKIDATPPTRAHRRAVRTRRGSELRTDGLLRDARWNALMAAGPQAWHDFRARLIQILAEGAEKRAAVKSLRAEVSLEVL